MSSSTFPASRRCFPFQHLPVVGWSELSYDLVEQIANKFDAVEDLLAFSAVCRSWRFIYLKKNWTPICRIPLLMLNEGTTMLPDGHGKVCKRYFFSVFKDKTYKFQLPEVHDHRCWGTSHGWVVTNINDLKMSLLNPITKVRIELPPHPTVGVLIVANVRYYTIRKAALLKIRDEFVIMTISGEHRSLAFTRLGDSKWTTLKLPTPILFVNVVCFNDQIYALSLDGKLVLVEIDGPGPPRATYIASPPRFEKDWRQIHLAESFGDLLMVFCYPFQRVRVKFKVYKFDFNAKQWTLLESLGERVLFVDDSHCVTILGRDGFKCNSIYFAKDNGSLCWERKEDDCDLIYCGVYSMEDGTIESFSLNMRKWNAYCLSDTPPMWLIPTL